MIKIKLSFLVIIIFLSSFFCNIDSEDPAAKPEPINSIISESTVKVLFIGNSLTFGNNMPDIFNNLSINAGKDVYVDQITPSGVSLNFHSYNKESIDKINEQKWTYIILQSNDITAFPDMYNDEVANINRLKNHIKRNNEKTKIIYLMVWSLRDGWNGIELNGEKVFYSYEEYMNKIYNGTIYISEQCDVIIAPVGWIWKHIIEEKPEIKSNLFAPDGAHPALYGSYITAYTYFVTIFLEELHVSIQSIDIPTEIQMYFQAAVNPIVLDHLELWNNILKEKE